MQTSATVSRDLPRRQIAAKALRPVRVLLAFLSLVFLFASHGVSFAAEDASRDPKIFAHHMGSLNAGSGAMRWHSTRAHLEMPDPENSNGPIYRNWPLVTYGTEIGFHGSADLDIRRAMRIGIDGFAINAIDGFRGDNSETRKYLTALFEVAEANDYPFEIAICLDPATFGLSENEGDYGRQYQSAVDTIQYLLDNHGDSPKLARRDGKPLIFGYMSGYIAIHYARAQFNGKSDEEIRSNAWGWEAMGQGYRELENQVKTPLYLHFCMQTFFYNAWDKQQTHYAEAADILAKHVDAVGEFLPAWIQHAGATPPSQFREAAERVKARGKEWSHPIFFQYENSGSNAIYPVKGTDAFQEFWKEARENSTLLQYSTWNDFHEITNLAPDYNSRYAIFDLASYYIDWWKSGSPPEFEEDKVYIFSRKYPEGARTFPFQNWGFIDGVIEVVTVLTEPATIHLPNRGTYEAPAGFFSKQFPVTPGEVGVEVRRNGAVAYRLRHPEPVTERPFRQDNGVTAISSECLKHWRKDFGDELPFLLYSEYGDWDGDGLPNWFEMYWFGRFLDFSTATGANPDEDFNNSGRTNLEEYLQQRNPVADSPVPDPSADSPERGPFHGSPAKIPGRIQAQDFDKGGQGTAYNETIHLNQGLHYRREESVDIGLVAWHPDPLGGDFHVGWTRPGEWLNYTVEVAETGYYDVAIRHGSGGTRGGELSVAFDGKNLTGTVQLPLTGSWGNWRTTTVRHIPLKAGVQVMRVRIEGVGFEAGFNLNFIDVLPSTSEPAPTIDLRVSVDTIVEGDLVEFRATPPTNDIGRLYFKVNGEIIKETSNSDWKVSWRPVEPGEYTVLVEALGFPGGYYRSPEVTLQVAPRASSFPEWNNQFFPFAPLSSGSSGASAFTADPDGDGVPNLLEYALGGNPLRPGTAAVPQVTRETIAGETYMTLSFGRPHGLKDVVYEVQVSDNLTHWAALGETDFDIVSSGNWETVFVSAPVPADPRVSRFMRLHVSPNFDAQSMEPEPTKTTLAKKSPGGGPRHK